MRRTRKGSCEVHGEVRVWRKSKGCTRCLAEAGHRTRGQGRLGYMGETGDLGAAGTPTSCATQPVAKGVLMDLLMRTKDLIEFMDSLTAMEPTKLSGTDQWLS